MDLLLVVVRRQFTSKCHPAFFNVMFLLFSSVYNRRLTSDRFAFEVFAFPFFRLYT